MIITWSLLNWIFTILTVLVTGILYYIYNRMNYFENHGIPYEKPKFLKGNMTGKYLSDVKRLYECFKNDSKPIFGMYILFNPTIVIKNLDLIKKILIKDFHTFPERGFYTNKKDDPLSVHLFNMDKEGWKEQRSKLSPTFTSGKMKYMFSVVDKITNRLAEALNDAIILNKNDNEIEMKEYLARYGTDVIGNVAFGIECNSLKDPNAEFREFGRKAVNASVGNFFGRILKANFPQIARFFKIRNQSIDVQQFCFRIVRETMNYRQDGQIKKNDFMDLLLEMRKTDKNPDGLGFDEIAAHTFVFFIAGFETTSTTMGFALYEMCINQEVQNKARNEVNEILEKHDGKMSYDCLEEMVYLEQVINETLRMYPPVIELNRRAVKDYEIEDTNLIIEKRMRIVIPISLIQRDPNLFDDPDKFIPERFHSDEMKNRHPMSFIPFGDGPRNCIGMRFGKMQAKLGLAILLKKFIFKPGKNLTIPIELDENAVLRQSKSGLWFKVNKIECKIRKKNSIMILNVINWITTILVAILTILILFIYRQITFFKRHKIPHRQPYTLMGNLTKNYMSDVTKLYNEFKNEPIFGMYLMFNPTVYLKDLDLIKNVLIKDFHTFPERGLYHNKKNDPLSAHLFAMDKEGWKDQRSKLSPTFTSGKMKYMFSTVLKITECLADVLSEASNTSNEIEMKEYLARYGTDVIGNVAFGVECNSLRDPNAEFREFGRKSVTNIQSNFFFRALRRNLPDIARFFGIRNIPVDVEKFCFQIVRQTMDYRTNNNIKRNDFMDLLLAMKRTDANPNGLEFGEIAAHTFVFFIAGFETTSTTMGFALYEMCLNQEVQNKARNEIIEILEKHDGKMSYDCLEEMVYLEQVINETLRMYPPLIELHRHCVKDYKVLNTDYIIPANSQITIPISDIHRDPKYYKNPNEFMPERFTAEEMQNRHQMSFIPFGDGPRNCIGMRFGKMQAKLGLATLLRNFEIHPGDNLKVPIVLNETAVLRQSKHGLWFKIKKLNV
ncbi:uncharacterized protein LOC129608436 [Condylostylus longicornis]|uniref:uncharacterized protein LOC129608436 n=1 Tax=Condylostylus longicornis TaxID=2530218 RepID=UPI00244E1437|nr:uncharacterized protein LOC129608436 [Condylostylus longicornis]